MYNIIDTIFVSLYHMKILTYKKGVSFLLINGKNETIKEDTKPFPTFTLVVVFSNMYISTSVSYLPNFLIYLNLFLLMGD